MEYEESGSLRKLDKITIDDTQKMIIIYGIAKGLQFLHHLPMCHRDLNPLICDFGNSRQISMVHVDEGTQRGTTLYMSPEMLKIDDVTTEVLLPSDIFSFGVVVYNLLTDKMPYSDEIDDLNQISLSKFLNDGKRIKLPDSIPSWFRALIQLCWKQNPDERPTIDDIVNLFDAGIALPSVFDDEQTVRYFQYLNGHLRLNIPKMDKESLSCWYNRLLRNNKKELALVIDFMLADYFNISNSQSNLGYLYFNGILVTKNYDKAIAYIKKAAENEDPRSLFYLSEIYKFGLPENDIIIDLAESNKYLQLSANHEYAPAIELLEKEREFSEISKEDAPMIVVFGDGEVGKTSFINRIVNKDISEFLLFPTSSIYIRYYYLPVVLDNNKKGFIYFRDAPNFSLIRSSIQTFFDSNKNVQLAILIFDKTNKQTFNNIDNYVNLIRSQTRCKIMIVGNKLDSFDCNVSYSNLKEKANMLNIDYFYEVSALKSTNIEMVSDEIKKNVIASTRSGVQEQISIRHFCTDKSSIKAIIVGSSTCGKTSFINYVLNRSFRERPDTTIGVIIININIDLLTLNIIDTAGQERYIPLLPMYIHCQTLFIIMFDLSDLISFHMVNIFYKLIINNVSSPVYKILIFGNKNDLNNRREVPYDDAIAQARALDAEYIEISCKTGYNIDMALHLIEEAHNYIQQQISKQNISGTVNLTQEIVQDDQPKNECSC